MKKPHSPILLIVSMIFVFTIGSSIIRSAEIDSVPAAENHGKEFSPQNSAPIPNEDNLSSGVEY